MNHVVEYMYHVSMSRHLDLLILLHMNVCVCVCTLILLHGCVCSGIFS